MTLDERIGQITQVDRTAISPDEVAELGIGSILSGGGGNPDPNTPATWRAMVDEYVDASRRSRLGIPILYGTDAVHGHNNVVGATIFPHNIGLGAAGDRTWSAAIGRATALETAATGARWTFAPTVAVPQDPRWGRTYEGYGQDPELVAALGRGAGRRAPGPGSRHRRAGLRQALHRRRRDHLGHHRRGRVVDRGGCAPTATRLAHRPGRRPHRRGDPARGPPAALPRRGRARASAAVMASYSSWNGDKVHAHRWLLTDLLKGELGFEGFVVTDYLAVDQVSPDYREAVVRCLTPASTWSWCPSTTPASGTPCGTRSRRGAADRAARRRGAAHPDRQGGHGAARRRAAGAAGSRPCWAATSTARWPAGPRPPASWCWPTTPGAAAAAGRRSVLVAGAAADDVGLACGGWTIEWGGGQGPITPGSTLAEGLRDHLGARVQSSRGDRGGPGPLEGLQAGSVWSPSTRRPTPRGWVTGSSSRSNPSRSSWSGEWPPGRTERS
jgi:beta-glucosidase